MHRTVVDPARPRFLLLDLLRVIGAIGVVLYHYTARRHSQWGAPPSETFPFLSDVTAYGFLGIQLFFLLSGFVIFFSTEGRTVGQFVSARVSRLYPAYWAAVILASLLLVVIAPPQLGRELSLAQILTNLTMLQPVFGVPHVDGVYWTLMIELLFYTMIALLISVRLTEAKVTWFVVGWPLLGALAQTTGNELLVFLLSPAYSSLFAAGMVIYLLHSRGHSLLRWLLLAFNFIVSIQQFVSTATPARQYRLTGNDYSEVIGALVLTGIFIAVVLIVLTPAKHWGWAWLSTAGALTYPLYLVHEYWGWWIIGISHEALGKWGALAAAFAVSVGLALILERWVERPLRPWMRAGLQRSFDLVSAGSRGERAATVPNR